MCHTKEQLIKDLYNLGIRAGDMVLMHSSYKSLGGIEGGAKAFFEGFTELLGKDGTLILPTLSFESVIRENPEFDIKTSPSCVGYLSEYFRTSVAGSIRSMHATHSCAALGRFAKEITAGHEKDSTPVGSNSPFAKLPEYGGKILMLGCSTGRNTSMHGVEETCEPPYCLDREHPIEYILKNGDAVIHKTSYRHNFTASNGKRYTQRYDRVVDLLGDTDKCFGKVLDADCCLMNSKAVWEVGRKKLLEDPFYFVDCPKN